MTDIEVHPMDRAEAQRITERIRLKLDSVASGLDALSALVADAHQRRADLALGYGSWAEYAEAEFSEQTHHLAAPIRRELVGRLTEAGMSTRAIAPAVGGSHMQVQRDRAAGVTERYTSAPDPLAEDKPAERIDHETGEVVTEPRKITGLDGKTYARPEAKPAQPKRRALPDQAYDAATALTAALDKVERIFADDRYPQNREQVARATRNHLLRTIEVCQDLVSQLPEGNIS